MSATANTLCLVFLIATATAVVPLWTLASAAERIARAIEDLRDMARRGRQ